MILNRGNKQINTSEKLETENFGLFLLDKLLWTDSRKWNLGFPQDIDFSRAAKPYKSVCIVSYGQQELLIKYTTFVQV